MSLQKAHILLLIVPASMINFNVVDVSSLWAVPDFKPQISQTSCCMLELTPVSRFSLQWVLIECNDLSDKLSVNWYLRRRSCNTRLLLVMSLNLWVHRRDLRSDARLHRFHFSLRAWSFDLIKGYWKSVWWIFRYSFYTNISGMSRFNCIAVWRQAVHYFQSNRPEPLGTESFSFQNFEIYGLDCSQSIKLKYMT